MTKSSAMEAVGRPALFLDRDGVVNVDKEYVHKTEDFEFIDGIFELCRVAARQGMAIVIVTNQAGIGRGYYDEAQYQLLTSWMVGRFADEQVTIAAVYHCPYHPEHGVGHYRRESFDRKPNPGMLIRARDELRLDLSRSVMIGDRWSDIAAAQAAGVKYTIYIGDEPKTCDPTLSVSSLEEAKLRFPTREILNVTR